MKGLALATVGLWVILQTTYGPLATKIGLITGGTGSSTSSPPSAGGSVPISPPGAPYKATTPDVENPVPPTLGLP